MRRSGWDARRRNKNIGTAKSGRSQNNRMSIPERWIGAEWIQFHEKLNHPVVFERIVNDRAIVFLVEPVQPGFFHACTPDDIVQILELLPQHQIEGIDLIVLRQPKRKERILDPVWGRLRYWTKIHNYSGVAIHIEAQADGILYWQKPLIPENIQELTRLEADGHQILDEPRRYVIKMTAESIRATQLYRTLPHEVGHYADYLSSMEKEGNSDLFWCKSSKDKEDFAHRYAREFVARQKKAGNIPFPQKLDESVLMAEGLSVSWFMPFPATNSIE